MKSAILRVLLQKSNRQKDAPHVDIRAEWLRDMGFTEGKQYWIEHNAERILLRLDDETIQQKARNRPYKTPRTVAMYFHQNRWELRINLYGLWLHEVGFTVGRQVLIQYGVVTTNPRKFRHYQILGDLVVKHPKTFPKQVNFGNVLIAFS